MFPHRQLGVVVAAVLFFGLSSASEGLGGNALLFPSETDYSYVKLVPQKPLQLQAFTLCMTLATELDGKREIILFAYRTKDFDELNVWREKDGRLSFYLSGDGVFFNMPPLSTFKTNVCVTWNSTTGLSAFWMDGKRSARQVYKPGHTTRIPGTVILGQDPDIYLGKFDSKQSYVGEISNVNMWDYVLSDSDIQALHCDRSVPKGNIFDWNSIPYENIGDVLIIPDGRSNTIPIIGLC
ncbi:C-reactive protein-like isoform X1 [Paramormyrops kingsleyae]|uniref:C-reactive protein-like isoform X1 n=1 Tax=Paramormyrops kingsleyae TaxID=1676925 RepID=UPI003B97A825